MGAKANLVGEPTTVFAANDTVVIRQYVGGKTGGVTLDMTDFKEEVVKAGHLTYRKLDEDGKNYTYLPVPVSNGAYSEIPEGGEYTGVVVASKLASEPLVAIMDNGRVNDVAMPYPLTDELRAKLKTVLPNLIFEHD